MGAMGARQEGKSLWTKQWLVTCASGDYDELSLVAHVPKEPGT